MPGHPAPAAPLRACSTAFPAGTAVFGSTPGTSAVCSAPIPVARGIDRVDWMELKRRLVGTRTGQLAQEMRKWLSLRRVAFSNPEKASAIANSIIADRLVTRLCRPGATFLDIGGHIGAISSAVQAFDPSVRILVVEAEPGKAQALSGESYARALDYIRADENIWEVILTGGDPLMLSARRLRQVMKRAKAASPRAR